MSQLCEEAKGPIIPYVYKASSPSSLLPCSYDVITGKVYCKIDCTTVDGTYKKDRPFETQKA